MPSVFPPGARLGLRYRLARVVAHGPLAALYEAHDLESGDLVAFKWLHAPEHRDATLSRLADRAHEAQRLHEPGLVDVLDVVRERDSLFVVSRWEAGQPYSHLLAHHLMPRSQRLAVLAAAFAALEAGHHAGVAHGGLHPDNLFLGSRSGVAVKVLDLALNQTCCAALFGQSRVGAGHHVYMAPEQLEPDYTPNVRTDVFAAAVLVFQALSGRLPFSAHDAHALRLQFTHEPPRVDLLSRRVPRSLATLLAQCLRLRPEQRPAELAELRGALERYAREVEATPSDGATRDLPLSATQSLARGELSVPPPEPESESVSQPLSQHGEYTLRRRGTLWSALALGTSLVGMTLALSPSREPRTRYLPPPLPEAEAAAAPDAAILEQPAHSKPAAAKPSRAAKKHPRRPQRSGQSLRREDF